MEVLIAIGSKIGEYLVEGTIHQARYLFCFNSSVEDLEAKENELKSTQDRIKKEVEREEKNTKEIEKEVEKWLKDADDVMADVQRLKAEIEVKKSCLNGWCPNWGCRYWLSRKATKKTSIMSKLQNTGKFSTVAHLKPLPGIEFFSPGDVKYFKATELASDQLIEALRNEYTKLVGLYGAGGVGKTTLATDVGRKLKQQQVFDEVVTATVSQNPNILDVQTKLAGPLGLELKEETKEERAQRLHLRFTQTKSKILIILDDVWENHDLKNEFGIPVDDNLNGCKVLLTTRRRQLCRRMDCNQSISLDILEPEEGLALLEYHAGINGNDSTLIDVSKEIAGECKGLPLAIVAVGSALRLRGKDVDEWNRVYHKLKTAELDGVDDVDVNVYACLKLSYDYLRDKETKLCFLLCSLFPEDFEIDLEELVRYGVGLGWYQGVETIEEARSQLRGMIKGLKDSSLLLDAGKEGFVKMHDVVRDVAIRIGSEGGKFFNGVGLTEWPEDEGVKQCKAISLLGNKKNVLPPNCWVYPNLHTLLLGNYGRFSKDRFVVSDQFFEGMTTLKVVTIRDGDLSIKSLQFLTNLQVLQLIRCDVRGMAFLGKLKRLQILCLKGSFLDEIPDDLADELSKLKLLDLGDFHDSEVRISVIKRFSQLQKFYGRMTWEVEGTNAECLSKDFTFPQLQRYDIVIREDFSYRGRSMTKALSIENTKASSLLIFSALYQNVQYLYLKDIQGCQNILPSLDQRGLNELTFLELSKCEDLEWIMDASQHVKSQNLVMLSSLATLHLKDLQKLQCIWKAPAQHVDLRNLTKVKVEDCNNLTYLFSLSQARSLVQLKKLLVIRCERLEYIIEAKFDDNERRKNIFGGDECTIAFPMLKKLTLDSLPNLTSLSSRCYFPTCQALQKLSLISCPRLTGRADEFVQNLAENLQYLCLVKVKGCQSIFRSTNQRDFNELTTLIVRDCEDIECILDVSQRVQNMLPKLRELTLESLPNLIIFCSKYDNSIWPALQKLTLINCPRLTSGTDEFVQNQAENLQYLHVKGCYHLCDVILARLEHGLKKLEDWIIGDLGAQVIFQLLDIIVDGQKRKLFPNLKRLSLYDLPEMKVLYKGPRHIFNLQNLTSLDVGYCHRLRDLLIPTLIRNELQLDELIIGHCRELEQIIEEDEK